MARPLFLSIVEDIEGFDKYLTHWPDAVGKWELNPIMKIEATLRMLAYGATTNFNVDYIALSRCQPSLYITGSLDLACQALITT